ncbi:hypothetical protein [Streptomyces sp. NBC_00989]|uniref:hypothetical protein n=1 Tax=Streptomyces sp. NBC_00989 TaxID=2903705 RepID=UPI003864BC09|nr:hypothetical protein OG714_38205 [Streptomyces sp. NBC_00989]
MTRRLPEHLTRHQAVFLALLLLHAVFWLVISLIQPSLQVLLICLTSFATVLATMALLLSASEASGKRRQRWRCADCDVWNAPGEDGSSANAPCMCCGGTRRQDAP